MILSKERQSMQDNPYEGVDNEVTQEEIEEGLNGI